MNISEAGLDLIRAFEGCRLTAYRDSVGIFTLGFGHTKGVKEGDTCTQEQADQWLKSDAHIAENCVNACVSVPLSQGEFDACVSFVFNLGCGNFRHSTLLRKLNDSDYDGAAKEFSKWCKAGGRTLEGLVKRREAERQIFES